MPDHPPRPRTNARRPAPAIDPAVIAGGKAGPTTAAGLAKLGVVAGDPGKATAKAGKRRKGPTPEGAVLRACIDLLTLRGVLHWRNNSGGMTDARGQFVRFGKVGSADILGVLDGSGRLLACECKAPGKRPTASQSEFLESVVRAGGVAVYVDDAADLAHVLDTLEIDPDVTGPTNSKAWN